MWVSVASSFCHKGKALGPWASGGHADPGPTGCSLSPTTPGASQAQPRGRGRESVTARNKASCCLRRAAEPRAGRAGGEGGGGWDPSSLVCPRLLTPGCCRLCLGGGWGREAGTWVRLPGHHRVRGPSPEGQADKRAVILGAPEEGLPSARCGPGRPAGTRAGSVLFS